VRRATPSRRGFGAQSELESIQSRTREAIRNRVKAGKVAGGACYGYDLVKPNPEVPTVAMVNAGQADVIRRIFAEYAVGWTDRRNHAQEISFTTPRMPAKRRDRGLAHR
jgi:DNA invertase Pin-like site-specific DNA recombinase